jgi:SagB-type dehydrogenase family enzyme
MLQSVVFDTDSTDMRSYSKADVKPSDSPTFCQTNDYAMTLSLAQDANLVKDEEGWSVSTPQRSIRFKAANPLMDTVLTKISGAEGVTMVALRECHAADPYASHARLSLAGQLSTLLGIGAVCYRYRDEAGNYAKLHMVPQHGRVIPPPSADMKNMGLSRDVFIRKGVGEFIVESIGNGAVLAMSPALAPFFFLFDRSETGPRHAVAAPPPLTESLAAMLWLMGALTDMEDEDRNVPINGSFADRLFHARSRLGSHSGGYGATYPGKTRTPGVQLASNFRPPVAFLALPPVDLAVNDYKDKGFADVLRQRRSIREYTRPMNAQDLSNFLSETCRIQQQFTSDGIEYSFRPYPNGGALHELEIYLAVNRCDGIPEGLYRYLPDTHGLEVIAIGDKRSLFESLLSGARNCAGLSALPPILMMFTAKFGRVQWKYESIAYSLVLKHVGCLFQTMYLVATALGLAPCALGGGSTDTLAHLAGLNPDEENAVGEFIIG